MTTLCYPGMNGSYNNYLIKQKWNVDLDRAVLLRTLTLTVLVVDRWSGHRVRWGPKHLQPVRYASGTLTLTLPCCGECCP